MRARRIIEDTDWPQIAGLYEVLLRISPSPVIELNHAAAISMVDGPARALDLIDALEARGGLDGYELLPAVRADLLRRLGRHDAARDGLSRCDRSDATRAAAAALRAAAGGNEDRNGSGENEISSFRDAPSWRRPGIHTPCRGYKFRARAEPVIGLRFARTRWRAPE